MSLSLLLAQTSYERRQQELKKNRMQQTQDEIQFTSPYVLVLTLHFGLGEGCPTHFVMQRQRGRALICLKDGNILNISQLVELL